MNLPESTSAERRPASFDDADCKHVGLLGFRPDKGSVPFSEPAAASGECKGPERQKAAEEQSAKAAQSVAQVVRASANALEMLKSTFSLGLTRSPRRLLKKP